MIWTIPADQYAEHRDSIRPLLERFEERDLDGTTADDLEREILAREAQLWVVGQFAGICLTRVTRESVRLDRYAGDNGHWRDVHDHIAKWAMEMGKARLVCTARYGLDRIARGIGYREVHREYTMELKHG